MNTYTRLMTGALLLGGLAAGAQAADLAAGLKVGTLGVGVELTTGLTDHVNARLGLNGFNYSDTATEDDIDYDTDLRLGSLSALLDWHPTGGGFRVSGGLLINRNELELDAASGQDFDIGGTDYRGDLNLNGLVDFRRTAPYVGIGWGNGVSPQWGSWSFSFDLGVLFQGEPQVNLDATGTATRLSDGSVIDVSTDTQFQEDLRQEQRNLEDDLEDFQFYPVISIGAMYRF